MGISVIAPEQALADLLQTRLDDANNCLWCVAYVDRQAVKRLLPALERLLKSKSRSLRFMMKTDDFRTEPEALDMLLTLKKDSRGRLDLRYCGQPSFHAKFFGFKSLGDLVAIVGSANLSQKALDPGSGELGVQLTGKAHAKMAWDAAERFWTDGFAITRPWLAKYRAKVEKLKKMEKASSDLRESLRPRARHPRLPAPSNKEPLWFTAISHMTSDDQKTYDSALRSARRKGEVDQSFSGGTVYWGFNNKPLIPAQALAVQLTFSDHASEKLLKQVCLIRTRAPARFQDPKSKRWLWVLPSPSIRGSSRKFTNRDKAQADKILRIFGLHRHALAAKVSGKDYRLKSQQAKLFRRLIAKFHKLP
ncbi:MAG: restriction endonuclease PLD domain-containing protein [Hyalangium sp.]|uniref:restriction endonuclease PLD domain-containing protein n=1 Tax=Hyalangium sp. TaxID=2028555 RepID=UPI00389B2B2B